MKKTNKKGFTIVELVIVIAVIAILSAVLIPTFSGIIKKARINADTQVVRNLNTSLSADEALNGKATVIDKVRNVLYADGYVLANLNPTTDGWYYVWEANSNQMLLVTDEYKVYYPQEMKNETAGSSWWFVVPTQQEADSVKSACQGVNAFVAPSNIDDAIASIGKGGTINLDESITLTTEKKLEATTGTTTINLGESAITTSNNLEGAPIEATGANTEINVVGGILAGTGNSVAGEGAAKESYDMVATADNGSSLSFDNTTINLDADNLFGISGNASLYISNSNMRVVDGYITEAQAGTSVIIENSTIASYSSGLDGGYALFFSGNNGSNDGATKVTLKNVKYSGATISSMYDKAELIIESGEYTFDQGGYVGNTSHWIGTATTAKFFYFWASSGLNSGSTITISGGTFQGKDYKTLTEQDWIDSCVNRSGLAITVTGAGTDTVVITLG